MIAFFPKIWFPSQNLILAQKYNTIFSSESQLEKIMLSKQINLKLFYMLKYLLTVLANLKSFKWARSTLFVHDSSKFHVNGSIRCSKK